jgi:hypothetical protein
MRLRSLVVAAVLAAPAVLSAEVGAVILPGDYPAAAEREIHAAAK